MRIGCWITNATDTHSENVMLIAFPRQQWLHVRASVLRFTEVHCFHWQFELHINCFFLNIQLIYHVTACRKIVVPSSSETSSLKTLNAPFSFETSVNIYEWTQRNVTKHVNLYQHLCENLTSRTSDIAYITVYCTSDGSDCKWKR
jgi:hypothetical protein